MSVKYIIRKRQNKILYGEIFIVAVAAGTASTYYYKVGAGVGLLIGVGVLLLLSFLFTSNRIFRYSFSLLFSLLWAAAAFVVAELFESSGDIPAWVYAVLTFVVSVWAHKDHFTFLKSAKLYEYEPQ